MSDSSVQIQRCLDRLQAGEEQAREELLRQACERLARLTRKMLRSYDRVKRWEQTDDVLQNASLRLCRALREVTPASVRDFFRLAAVSIRRELIDMARHYYGPQGQGAHHDSGGRTGAVSVAGDSSQDPSRLAAWGEFHRQVETLPDEERAVVDLLWYQELTQPEAARLLDISERTVKRRWQAARLKLHRVLRGGED